MDSRSLLLASVLAPFAVGLVACEDSHDFSGGGGDDNEIVFGIRQEAGADGKTTVSAEYEFLSLAHQGGWVTQVFRDGDGEGVCYFERFDHRIGKPRVESGAASFTGGQLPPAGLQILANQNDPAKADGAGWMSGDALTFQVSGFAMPPVRKVSLSAPPTTLDITSVTPALAAGATSLALKATDDIHVAWTPTTDPRSTHVMVSLVTDEANGPGGEVRCFGSGASGSVTIPSLWVGNLFSSVDPAAAIAGHLEIASHRQADVRARGDWTVYVVATALHRDQAFTGSR